MARAKDSSLKTALPVTTLTQELEGASMTYAGHRLGLLEGAGYTSP